MTTQRTKTPKSRRSVWWYVLAAMLVFAAIIAIVITIDSARAAPFGNACVTSPESVASGTAGSIFVQDARGIAHYSTTGTLLARFAPRQASFATDRAGNIYFPQHNAIVEASGTGAILRRIPAPGYQPEAIDRQGNIIAVQGGSSAAVDGTTAVERLSPTGRLLSRWTSAYASSLAAGADGFIYGEGGLNAASDLVKLDPATGKVVKRFYRALGVTFDVVTAGPDGTIYVGVTNGGDAPFAVQKLTQHGSAYSFTTLNTSQESITGLAVDTAGPIFVIRASYDEPGASGGTGLEVLSSSGSGQGRVSFCAQ